MLFRTLDGKLLNIEKKNFTSDKLYYSDIKNCFIKNLKNIKNDKLATKGIDKQYIKNKTIEDQKYIIKSYDNTGEFIKKYL